MTTLEKILHEIEERRIIASLDGNFNSSDSFEKCEEIIKKHLSDNDGWIPVEERLPEKDGVYDFTVINGNSEKVVVTWQFLSGKHLSGQQTYIDGIHYLADNYKGDPINEFLSKNVIAWRYRPEPYRKGGE